MLYIMLTAVRNALGLNKPLSQTVAGVIRLPAVHAASCSYRFNTSWYQPDRLNTSCIRVLITVIHRAGTYKQ